jgi:hypothetical protein
LAADRAATPDPSPVAARQPGIAGQRIFVTAAAECNAGAWALAEIECRAVTEKTMREADKAREALSDLQESLDSAKRLVERTRFLLIGAATPAEAALIAGGEAQAASPATSETVQNPSGE